MKDVSLVLGCVLVFLPVSSSKFKSVVDCPQQGTLLHGTVEQDVYNQERKFRCDKGFKMSGASKQICGEDGLWHPLLPPTCIPALPGASSVERLPCLVPDLQNAEVHYESWNPRDQAPKATVVCAPGFTTVDPSYKESYLIVCSQQGLWTMEDGHTLPLQCLVKRCPIPPTVPKAIYRYRSGASMMGEGSQIGYTCNSGYVFVDPSASNMTCRQGQWTGDIPRCVEVQTCDTPPSISDGNYNIVRDSRSSFPAVPHSTFFIGSKVAYKCNPHFKLLGSKVLECLPNKEWSSIPPQCVPIGEPSFYCHAVGDISNGRCKCRRESDSDLQRCEPSYSGVQIECSCEEGFQLEGASILTCVQSNSLTIGTWDHNKPMCLAVDASDVRTDSNYPSPSHVSTLVIVIATACSVLGVLLLIMVIVVFRRRKPRPHLFHPGTTPMPYSRVHSNSIDEQDRLALMAYADATRVHLPTYEEATGGQCRPSTQHPAPQPLSNPTTEFRPLPSIPATLRAGENSNRHSTVTTSTINRDATSEIFGSLDTVNVSMSDASTSVTVETYDSGTSMRSIASQEATAGSFTASDDNLANDDAPLLENTGETQSDSSSTDSLPSQDRKEE